MEQMKESIYDSMDWVDYESENYIWTGSMEFKISHNDLHALGDPDLLLLHYDEVSQCFYLCAVQDEKIANLKLRNGYYEFVRQETKAYPKGDYGPNVKLKPEFEQEFKKLGWEPGKTYLVPCMKLPFDLLGKEVPALYYFLRDGYSVDD